MWEPIGNNRIRGRGCGPGGYFWANEQIVWMLNGKRFGVGSAVCSQGPRGG